MRYPGATKRAVAPNSQRVPRQNQPSPRRALPRPANDNRRPPVNKPVKPLPTPANDNVPRKIHPRAPAGFRLPPGALGALRVAARALPWIGLGMTALTIAEMIFRWQRAVPTGWPGWERHHYDPWVPHPSNGSVYVFWTTHGHSQCRSIDRQSFQTLPHSNPGPGVDVPDIPAGNRWVTIGPRTSSTLAPRYDQRETWAKIDDIPTTEPTPWLPEKPPVFLPPVVPELPQWIDPLAQPINKPTVNPSPRPLEFPPAPNPWRSPTESSSAGNNPIVRGRTESNTSNNPAPRPNSPRKPKPKTKERKTVSVWAKMLFQLHSAGTEVDDWVDSFYDAMPNAERKAFEARIEALYGRPPTAGERALFIYRNINAVDMTQALKNVVYNVIEDAIAGKGIKWLDKAGIGIGPTGQPYVKRDFLAW